MAKFRTVFLFLITGLVFVLYGWWQATSSEKTSLFGPKIAVEPTTFDFGEVRFGKIVKHAFEVKNIGGKTLKIKRVSTSCACTQAQVKKEKLEPGETTELLVTYDAGAMGKKIIGQKIERFIYIKSNDSQKPQVEIIIQAKVI